MLKKILLAMATETPEGLPPEIALIICVTVWTVVWLASIAFVVEDCVDGGTYSEHFPLIKLMPCLQVRHSL